MLSGDDKEGEPMRKSILVVFAVVALGLVVTCQKQKSQPVAEPDTQAIEHSAGEPEALDLVGTSWLAESIDGVEVVEGAQSTLMFIENGDVSGNGACNRFMGAVQIEGDRIAIGHLASTKMACPEAVMDQENRFMHALARADRVKLSEDGSLMLFPAQGEPTRLAPLPAAEGAQ
jgi:putative lipoprotein